MWRNVAKIGIVKIIIKLVPKEIQRVRAMAGSGYFAAVRGFITTTSALLLFEEQDIAIVNTFLPDFVLH
jgi:hypothetical protein